MLRWKAVALGLAIVASLSGSGTALAQAQAEAHTETTSSTLLHLSASSAVQAAPDQLRAELVAQSTSSSLVEAQRHVNTLMADGLRAAEGVSGMDVRATGYSVHPTDDKRTSWSAQQVLELRGSDGPALLDLVNRLQAKGFAVASLDWQLSPALRRKSYDEATMAALKELQMRAAAAATTLGLHVDHLQDVRLGGPMLLQSRLPMQAMAARAAPPLQATAAPEEVTAEVSADVVLRP